jgi:hypothetical protein
VALNEILNGAIKDKVHICGKEPENPPPNSSITSEQLLSLAVEFFLKEPATDQKDFFRKLAAAILLTAGYQNAVQKSLKLHQIYLQKIQVAEKELIYQEYQTEFQKIAASVANLTSEILSKLEKNGFTLREVKWTGKLQAPSLTDELAVNFSFSKNK